MAIAVKILDQVDAIVRNLEKLGKEFDKKGQQRVLKKGAKVIQKEIKKRAPRSGDTNYRYNTAKLDKSKRAAKGSGNVVAAYGPGNFERSIQTMLFKRSPAVFVGPKIAKGNRTGVFSGRRVDGYTAHWIEYGTIHYQGKAPIRTGAAAAERGAFIAIESESRKIVDEFSRQLSLF